MNPTNTKTPIERTNHLKFVWGLICLIAPTALIILSIIAYAVINFIVGSTITDGVDGASFDSSSSVVRTIANIILYLVGALSVTTFVPGIVVGIILLATRKPEPSRSN